MAVTGIKNEKDHHDREPLINPFQLLRNHLQFCSFAANQWLKISPAESLVLPQQKISPYINHRLISP